MPPRLLRAVLAATLAALALPTAALAQSGPYAEGPGAISAYPSPGTVSAGPRTQISLRGARASRLGTIRVSGSRSGRHAGRLRAHSDGKGASFVLRRPFRGGERVTVRTDLPVRGTRNGDFTFRTARIPRRVTIQNLILENIDAKLVRRFRSRRDLAPPFVNVDRRAAGRAPGLLFLSPKSKKDQKQAGPMIADDAGQPVWFQPLPGIQAATDFRTQTYKGRPVLTYWQGTSRQGIGVGEMVVLDQSYRVIRRIRTPNGFRPDLHEFVITPNDTAIIITYPVVRTDLRKVKGARRGLAVDSVIQEIDLDTGLVVFEWHSLGKIPPDRDVLDAARGPARAVRLRAHQLGQPRHRRRLPDVGPQHLDDLQDRPRDGQHPLAPGRQEEHLPAPGGGPLRVAARRPAAQRRRDHAVRQRGVPAHPQVLARRSRCGSTRARGRPRSPTS